MSIEEFFGLYFTIIAILVYEHKYQKYFLFDIYCVKMNFFCLKLKKYTKR